MFYFAFHNDLAFPLIKLSFRPGNGVPRRLSPL